MRKNLSCEQENMMRKLSTNFIEANERNEPIKTKRNCGKVRLEFELMQLNVIDLFAC